MFKDQKEQDQALRRFAAGLMTFAALQDGGLENFLTVLSRLGELGLRPPTAPPDGPNADMRARGRAIIAERIRAA